MTTATTSHKITRRTARVPANLERYAFMFMRLSGVILLFLAVGHMLLQHVFNSSGNLTIQFVAAQWDSWAWKAYDLLLLFFAYAHGINGLRNVLEDYIHNRTAVKYINYFLVIFLTATILWSAYAIAMFNPEAVR